MLWPDVIDLKLFYASPMGHKARDVIARAISKIWPSAKDEVVLGIGYAHPYLAPYLHDADRVLALMPSAQGALHWPLGDKNLSFLADEAEIPLPDQSVNRVIIMHAFENTEQLRHMLREVWRVLVPSGRMLVVVPNRNGAWARIAGSPFAHGSPYSNSQLKAMLRDHNFAAYDSHYALFTPPTPNKLVLRSSRMFEVVGKRFFNVLGGVIISESEKQVFAPSQPKLAAKRKANGYVATPQPALSFDQK
ncbi:MAG: class I SAM-dependent methyltransferase [Alphaproteobacteria bacterium]|nr:class I SAM-dependent methyltransferase [Alphaproteobacteria bacterium]